MYADLLNYIISNGWTFSQMTHYLDLSGEYPVGIITTSLEPPVWSSESANPVTIEAVFELTLWPPVVAHMYIVRLDVPTDLSEARQTADGQYRAAGTQVTTVSGLQTLLAPYEL